MYHKQKIMQRTGLEASRVLNSLYPSSFIDNFKNKLNLMVSERAEAKRKRATARRTGKRMRKRDPKPKPLCIINAHTLTENLAGTY